VLAAIIDSFQERYPDVQFDVLYIPEEELRQRYETAVREGAGPSVLLGPVDWAPLLYDGGVVQDLTTLADPALLESLSPPAVTAGRYKGALVGLPYAQNGVVLYRNPNIVPRAPDTYEQMIEFGKENTAGAEIGAFLERSFFYGGAILEGIGGLLMDENGYPAFNNVKGVEWIELLRNYDLAGPISFQGDQDVDLFKEGRVGMIIDGTWNMDAISETLGADNVMIDPWPLYQQGALSGYVMPEMVYLNQRGSPEDQNATWEFIQYFLSPEAQASLATTGRIPTARDVTLQNPLQAQALSALLGGTAYPVRPEMAAYPSALDTALKSVFENGISPAVALQIADQNIRQALDAVKATPLPSAPTPSPTP
jgi:arabinogalactan oligomer/maltooligosaccharide transport system substrate-binding protein